MNKPLNKLPTLTRARIKGLLRMERQFGLETCNSPELDTAVTRSARAYVEQLRDWWEAKHGEDLFADEDRRKGKELSPTDINL